MTAAINTKGGPPPAEEGKRVDFGHGLSVVVDASERFHALPEAEREWILEEFRKTFAPAFASVDEYLRIKRREAER